LSGPIAVTVESRPGGDRTVFEIRLAGPGEASGEAPVVEQGPDAFLAVRSAFDRYELSSLDRSPSNVANTRGGNLRR
jgi:hypothetical protein